MLAERILRDVALALTGPNPARDLVSIEAVHGSTAHWFSERYAEEAALLGSEAASSMASDLSRLADLIGASPEPTLDLVAAYEGFTAAESDPAAFQRWLETMPRAAKSNDEDKRYRAREYARFARREPPSVGPIHCEGSAVDRGLVRLASAGDTIFDAWVDTSDCPLAVSRGAAQERGQALVACRDGKNVSGCPYFNGVGVDEMVRCTAARVAQMQPQPPKPGDELEVKKPDGTQNKVRVRRLDPDGSAVVDPTWSGTPNPAVV